MLQGKAKYQGSGEEVSFIVFDLEQMAWTKTPIPKNTHVSSRFGFGSGTYYSVDTGRGFFTPVSDGDVIIYHDKYREVISRRSFNDLYTVLQIEGNSKDTMTVVHDGYSVSGIFPGYAKTPDYLGPRILRRTYEDRDINQLAKEVAAWRKSKGFQTPSKFKDHSSILIKLMLVVSELSEASEAVRNNDEANFREEIADTIIRILDLTGTMGIDISSEIRNKMLANEKRPLKHGKSI